MLAPGDLGRVRDVSASQTRRIHLKISHCKISASSPKNHERVGLFSRTVVMSLDLQCELTCSKVLPPKLLTAGIKLQASMK